MMDSTFSRCFSDAAWEVEVEVEEEVDMKYGWRWDDTMYGYMEWLVVVGGN